MLTNFSPTDSRDRFVGRISELLEFDDILSGAVPLWLVHIPGEGGIGKTRLLNQFMTSAQLRGDFLVPSHLVDFYETSNQTDLGVMQAISGAIGPDHFPLFWSEFTVLQQSFAANMDPSERQYGINMVISAFLDDLRMLLRAGRRILLMFDTCEEMQTAETWVLETLLPQLVRLNAEFSNQDSNNQSSPHPHGVPIAVPGIQPSRIIVCLAGRKHLSFPDELRPVLNILRLKPLSIGDIREFFDSDGVSQLQIFEEDLTTISDLTGGRPMYVALCYDWLVNGVGTVDELITPSQNETFADRLVAWLTRLRTAETRAIIMSALAWRRMEAELLAILLDEDDVSHVRKLMGDLGRFSFVKYLGSTDGSGGRFQLHDEMRDLVLDRTLKLEGPFTRRTLLRKVISWYEARIGNQDLLNGIIRPSTDEERTLLAEWLFYNFEFEVQSTFHLSGVLFRTAIHWMDLTFCDLLNNEVRRFRRRLDLALQDELDFREALLALRREDYLRAKGIWRSLVRRQIPGDKLRATSLALLVQAEGYSGEPNEALSHAAQSEEAYNRLLLNTDDHLLQQYLQEELGELYNNWGYVFRTLAKYDLALDYYDRALEMEKGDARDVAATLNNMGYVHLMKGDPMKARTYVGSALSMRQSLGIAYDLGLSQNTMGILMEQSGRIDEAADLFEKALCQFQSVPSERGQALVWINQGRLNRRVNNFQPAIDKLERAMRRFERANDKAHLLEVFNELGCTYRQMDGSDYWELAESYLLRSLALSEELGDSFKNTDNLEDLSILYYFRARDAHRQSCTSERDEFSQKSRAFAEHAERLAKENDILYLRAKNQRTFGDLSYLDGDYQSAFDHYFSACLSMVYALQRGDGSAVVVQRRYEQMIDRLQEMLEQLGDPGAKLQTIENVSARLKTLPVAEQMILKPLAYCLDSSLEVTKKATDLF